MHREGQYCYLDPRRVRELREETKHKLDSLAAVLCWIEHRRRSRSGETTETWGEYEHRRKSSVRRNLSRKCSDSSRGKGTKWDGAEDLALALALGPTVLRRDQEPNWKKAERRAAGFLRRMELEVPGEAVCVDNLSDDADIPRDGRASAPDPAREILRGLVNEAAAVADAVREYVDRESAPLKELRPAGPAESAGNSPGLARLCDVVRRSGLEQIEVKQIDDAVRTARKELEDIEVARELYVAELSASDSRNGSQGFTAATMRQYAADCRADAEFADAMDRPDEAARARAFAKRYEAFGPLVGAVRPLMETITSLINRDVEHTDALHNRLESDCEALKRKAAVVLEQATRTRHRLSTTRAEGGATDGDV